MNWCRLGDFGVTLHAILVTRVAWNWAQYVVPRHFGVPLAMVPLKCITAEVVGDERSIIINSDVCLVVGFVGSVAHDIRTWSQRPRILNAYHRPYRPCCLMRVSTLIPTNTYRAHFLNATSKMCNAMLVVRVEICHR